MFFTLAQSISTREKIQLFHAQLFDILSIQIPNLSVVGSFKKKVRTEEIAVAYNKNN
jgi:patatin-like phospholipase/acyl hydrolase